MDDTMFRTGILVLTSPIAVLTSRIPLFLQHAVNNVSETLYVQLAPDISKCQPIPLCNEVRSFISGLYTSSSATCFSLDVRVLLNNITNTNVASESKLRLSHPCEVVLTDFNDMEQENFMQNLRNILPEKLPVKFISITTPSQETTVVSSADNLGQSLSEGTRHRSYDNVVLGGTFDRLHNGHKILLTQSCVLADKRMTIGVTEGPMCAKKTLCELICPLSQRISELQEFLNDVKPSLSYSLVPITDPYGPSIVDPDIQCIIVSEETVKGGNMVNDRRREKGLSELDVHVIDLVEDKCRSPEEEVKISSSSTRKRLLGTLLQETQNPVQHGNPYVIGLTGGIASGKSAICKRLEKLGAAIVDCDKLGHKAYLKGSETFKQVVQTFGQDVVDDKTGEIYRRALGAKVFADKTELQKLNNIVWPSIAQLAQQQIKEFASSGFKVVVLDAAVLLEADWDKFVQEIWVSVIPKQEAVKRIVERNKLSEEEALKRIELQWTNQERVNKSHVVLSTLWEYDVTQKQVEKAWTLLLQRTSKTSPSKM